MQEQFGFHAPVSLVGLLMMVAVVLVMVLPPLRQAQAYHQFADQRGVAGIPNFLNVVSKGGLLPAGLMGLRLLSRHRMAGFGFRVSVFLRISAFASSFLNRTQKGFNCQTAEHTEYAERGQVPLLVPLPRIPHIPRLFVPPLGSGCASLGFRVSDNSDRWDLKDAPLCIIPHRRPPLLPPKPPEISLNRRPPQAPSQLKTKLSHVCLRPTAN